MPIPQKCYFLLATSPIRILINPLWTLTHFQIANLEAFEEAGKSYSLVLHIYNKENKLKLLKRQMQGRALKSVRSNAGRAVESSVCSKINADDTGQASRRNAINNVRLA